MYGCHHVWALWTCGLGKIKLLRNYLGALQKCCPCGVVFSWRWSSSPGSGCSQTASLAACSGHTKNEMGQSPDVLTECWDAPMFTLLEKVMSLLLHTSVLKQKERWELVQNRAFQFYLAFQFCYFWVIVRDKDKALSCRNVLGCEKIKQTGDWQEVRAAPTQMQMAK